MLYELARNPTIQEDVYEELIQSNMRAGHSPPLLRACLKETLRLHPTAAGTSRVLDSDAVLSGYYIPKDVSFPSLKGFYNLLSNKTSSFRR